MSGNLNSAYEIFGIPFSHSSGTMRLILDESFETESNQIVFRGLSSELAAVEIGDAINSEFFKNNATFDILNFMEYGDYGEENLISVVKR